MYCVCLMTISLNLTPFEILPLHLNFSTFLIYLLFIYCPFTLLVVPSRLFFFKNLWWPGNTFSEIPVINVSDVYINRIISSSVLITLLILNFWRGYSFELFFNHLHININILYISVFGLLLFYISTVLILSENYTTIFSLTKLLTLYFQLILVLTLAMLFSSTNLYSSIVIVEFLTSLLFLITVLSVFTPLNLDNLNLDNLSRILSSLISFFWINTLTSVCLFLYLIYAKFFTLSWDFALLNSFTFIRVGGLWLDMIIMYTIILVIFIKCGLPPMLLWKCLLFAITPFSFIGFYIVNYYLFILIFIFKLLSSYILQVNFNHVWSYDLLTLTALIVLCAAIVSTIFFFNYNDWSVFFAVSSLFTTSLTLIIYILPVVDSNFNFSDNFDLTSYLFIYILTNLILIHLLLKTADHNYISGGKYTTFKSITPTLLQLTKSVLTRNLIFIVFICLASLPPTTQFIVKLYLIARIQLFNFQIISILVVLYLFVMLVFYFRNSKSMLADYTTLRLNFSVINWINYKGSSFYLDNPLNPNNVNCTNQLIGFKFFTSLSIYETTIVQLLSIAHLILFSLTYTGDIFLLNWIIFY